MSAYWGRAKDEAMCFIDKAEKNSDFNSEELMGMYEELLDQNPDKDIVQVAELEYELVTESDHFDYWKRIIKPFKDAAEAIRELHLIAAATKYRYDDVEEYFRDLVNDGDTIEEAFVHVRNVSLEYDW